VVQVVQLNSATAEESAASSEEMNDQAGVLTQLMTRFKLKDTSHALATAEPDTAKILKEFGLRRRDAPEVMKGFRLFFDLIFACYKNSENH